MKKWIVLSLAAAVLTACGQKEEKIEETSPKTEQQATATTETSSSSSNQEKTEKNSPADYPRFSPDQTPPSEDAIEATKPYAGYYTGTYTTTLDTLSKDTKDANIPLNYKMEVVIYDDGSYATKLTYEAEGGTQDQSVYITKSNEIKYILKGSQLNSGTFGMAYGQLESSRNASVYQTRLDSNGDILPIYKTEYDVYNLPYFVPSIESGNIFLIDPQPSSEDEALKIEMKQAGKIPKSLKFTPYQIKQYAKRLDETDSDSEEITFDFKNINEFVQYVTSPTDQMAIELIDPKTLTGYFTADNDEIKNIVYALRESDDHSIIAYDGKRLWSLSTRYDNRKEAKPTTRNYIYHFIDLRELEDN